MERVDEELERIDEHCWVDSCVLDAKSVPAKFLSLVFVFDMSKTPPIRESRGEVSGTLEDAKKKRRNAHGEIKRRIASTTRGEER